MANLRNGQETLLRVPHSHDVTFFARTSAAGIFAFYGSKHGEQRGFYQYIPAQDQVRPLWVVEAEEPLAPASWSPAGDELLFSTWPVKDGRFPVKVLRPDGKVEAVLYSGSRPFPRWSPAGQSIAYTDKNCLMIVGRSGGIARQVICRQDTILPRFALFSIGALDWLPDGSSIAWTVHNEPERRIEMWVVDARTGDHWVAWKGEKDYASWPADPAWAPDARHLAFRMEFKPDYEIWRLSQFLPR